MPDGRPHAVFLASPLPGALLAALAVCAGTPPATAQSGDDGCSGERVVEEGDSLWAIARECAISVRRLRDANGLAEDDVLRAGQRLRVPPPRRGRTREGADAADPPSGGGDGATAAAGDDRAASPEAGEHAAITFRRLQNDEEITVRLFDDQGRLRRSARRSVDRLLRHVPSGRTIRIHEDLLRLLQQVADHWPGRKILVQSAVRPVVERPGKPLGNHMSGRAIDFSVDGVSNRELRDFCRTLPRAGVGYYPNSTFVHLDARDRSWYWIDYSGPGESPRYGDPGVAEPAPAEEIDGSEDGPQPASGDGTTDEHR
jgi:uncharacterized protein YcbK (DUF882 family)